MLPQQGLSENVGVSSALNNEESETTKSCNPTSSTGTSLRSVPSSDFSSHFVVRAKQASNAKINNEETVANDTHSTHPVDMDVKPNDSVVKVTASLEHPFSQSLMGRLSPYPDKSDLFGRLRPLTAFAEVNEESSSMTERRCNTATTEEIPSTSSPRRASHVSHPFMRNQQVFSENQNLQSMRQRLVRSIAESPLDSSYTPMSMYCVRASREQEIVQINHPGEEDNTPFETILAVCGQRAPMPMAAVFYSLKNVEKIGEGVYGEVYSGTFCFFNQPSWVYKIVAIEGNVIVNGERQKRFSEVLPEIIISQELSKLRNGLNECYTDGYVFMKNARICRGRYPENLVHSWERFHEKYESDNDKPDFPSEQLYMVLEFEFAGQDIESLNFKDASQTLSIVLQVAHILAVGECALEFEHRDLHWGNILVETFSSPNVRFVINGFTLLVPAAGIKAVVIDFTVSRITSAQSGSSVFLDLGEDEEQFLGTGDHQFDIYRMMRDHNRNDWNAYSPKTNVFWLHYLANKLFVKGRYSNNARKSPGHREAIRKLKEISYVILEHPSARSFVLSKDCKEYKDFVVSCLPKQPCS